MGPLFFINSVLFGVGLAMDAFSVSLANGLNEPRMRPGKAAGIAGVFAFFQFAMPLLGWLAVHTIVETFSALQRWIPVAALILLLYLGIKMIVEGARHGTDPAEKKGLTAGTLLLQGVATSIDALSVGFTIASYGVLMALTEALIIAAVTFGVCLAGVHLGRRFGTKLSGRAEILGGVILIAIGLEIFIGSLL